MSEGEELECRICRGVREEGNPLYRPCKCSGSIAYVHEPCLKQWLKVSSTANCELCKHQFQFRRVYRDGAPSLLSPPQFLLALGQRLLRHAPMVVRFCILAAGWTFLLPLFARSAFSLVFFQPGDGALHFVPDKASTLALTLVEGAGVLVFIGGIVALTHFLYISISAESLEVEAALRLFEMEAFLDDRGVDAGPRDNADPLDLRGPGAGPAVAAALGVRLRELQHAAEEAGVDADSQLFRARDHVVRMLDQHGDLQRRAARRERQGDYLNPETPLRGLFTDLFFFMLIAGTAIAAALGVPFHLARLALPLLAGHFPALGRLADATAFRDAHGPFLLKAALWLLGSVASAGAALVGATSLAVASRLRPQLLRSRATLLSWRVLHFAANTLSLAGSAVLHLAFPLCCGWAVDLFTFPITTATLDARAAALETRPVLSTVVHCVLGSLFIGCIASVLSAFRAALGHTEAGAFLRFLLREDALLPPFFDAPPFLSVLRYFLSQALLYIPALFFGVHVPSHLLAAAAPSMLPVTFEVTHSLLDYQALLDFFFLQIAIPFCLERLYALRYEIRRFLVSILRDICSLWGAEDLVDTTTLRQHQPLPFEVVWGFARPPDAHVRQAQEAADPPVRRRRFLRPDVAVDAPDGEEAPPGAEPWFRRTPWAAPDLPPSLLHLGDDEEGEEEVEGFERWRLVPVWKAIAVTVTLISAYQVTAFLFYLGPLYIGRVIFRRFGLRRSMDLYAAMVGGFVLVAGIAVVNQATMWLWRRRWRYDDAETLLGSIFTRVHHYALVLLNLALWFLVYPILTGLVFELVVVVPSRVNLWQHPYLALQSNWLFGVGHVQTYLHLSEAGLLGEEQQRIFHRTLRELRFLRDPVWVLWHAVVPLSRTLLRALCIPYAVSNGLLPLFGVSPVLCQFAQRYGFLLFIALWASQWLLRSAVHRFRSLHDELRDERFLVGTQLVNLERG